MALEEEFDVLKIYWDHFFKAETGTYEKTTWLDLFLAEFLIRVKDGANPKELINFCPVSGVVSLVGCELLCGLHRVTSSVSQLTTIPLALQQDGAGAQQREEIPPTDKEQYLKMDEHRNPTSLFTKHNTEPSTEILRKYLLGGVAWKCLAMLKAIGVEGLSCCRQLSSVLIWVFGELISAPVPELGQSHPSRETTPIHQLFSPRIWSKQKSKHTGTHGSKNNSPSSSQKGSVIGRSKHSLHVMSDTVDRSKKPLLRQPTSDSAESNDDLQDINKTMTVKVATPQCDFDYYISPRRSPSEAGGTFYSDCSVYRKSKPKADDYMSDKQRELINKQITSVEFLLLITDLLQELCKAESSLYGSEGSQISVQCINFTLRNLCTLQFGSAPTQNENSSEVSRIKVALTELLIVSLDKVLIHSDLCSKLIQNGILPMMLRLLEDVISKSSNKYQTKLESQKRAKETVTSCKTETENLLKFVFGISYSITAFFHCLLMQCRSIDKLREFTDQFRLYGECRKGELLKECLELMIRLPGVNNDETVMLIKYILDSIGKLISGMKRIRSEILHSAACSRTRHKMCRLRVIAGMHHHHDILGKASNGLPMAASCCISILYSTLTSLMSDEEVTARNVLRNKLLKVMLKCGVCCCFPSGVLMESIVRLVLIHHNVATECLQLLEHTVYGELGASILIPKVSDQLPCSVCEPGQNDKSMKRYYLHEVTADRKNTWSFLIHYNSLLQLDNHYNVLHATVSHLLRVTPKCRMQMKYELLFSVIYPMFIVAKHRYMLRLEESAFFLTASCLNIFASLLSTVSFAEQFIQKGGLSFVLELVSLTEFANQCCAILEITITVEIFKMMKENIREMGSLTSVQMLFKSITDVTDKFYKIYEMKMLEDEFEAMCDLSKEMEALSFTPAVEESMTKRKMSSPKDIKQPSGSDKMIEETVEDYLVVLKNVSTFWKTCSGLCERAPLFRQYVADEPVFLESFAVLKLALRQLCEHPCGLVEIRLLVKLIEALLTVHFALADVTSDRSKQLSCRLVRTALWSERTLVTGGGLRALCEALVRVAAARLCTRHTMSGPANVKVPPLICPAESSSDEGSSSDDSISGPYASDHSDVVATRPDEGYEADVEVANLDLSMDKLRKFAIPFSDSSFASGLAAAFGGGSEESSAIAECGLYAAGGELAHPELCVIVVDILAQIINKVLDVVESEEPVPEETWQSARAGASVARACARRLCRAPLSAPPAASAPAAATAPASAAAASMASPAPAPLLRRLLLPRTARLLTQNRPGLHELQTNILELIHVLACQSLEASELAALFKLFLADSPPLSTLLPALQRLVDAAEPNTPDFTLTFPIDRDELEHVRAMSQEASAPPAGALSPPSHQAEAFAARLTDAHLRMGVASAWSASACQAGVDGGGWGAWLAGFAAAAWLRLLPHNHRNAGSGAGSARHCDNGDNWQEQSAESSGTASNDQFGALLHVFSIGNESLMFEMWADVNTGGVVFRITRPVAGPTSAGVGSEARVECALPPRRWNHVAVNVAERVLRRRILIQVTMFVNGFEYETISLPLQGLLVRKVWATNVLIGDNSGSCTGRGAYQLGMLRVYRSPKITRTVSLHLAAQSPSLAGHLRLESPNFPSVLTANIIDSEIDWDQVYDMPSNVMRELHDSLLLTFSAHMPSIVNLYYNAPIVMPSVFGVRGMGSSMGITSGGGSPEGVRVRWSGEPRARRRRGFATALHTLAGVPHLLYLYARVVELDGTPEEQAAALRIMLRACRTDGRLYAQLLADDTLDMLHAVLGSNKCHTSHQLLKVLLDEACSGPMLSVSGGGVLIVQKNSVALLEPALLVLVMNAWQQFDERQDVVWEVEGQGGRARGSAWALSLECCAALLRHDHPRRRYNHGQLSRADMLRHLLLACKERLLNSECGPLSAESGSRLVELVRGLVGAPPLLHHLALLTDFLLLMHQASDTFVTHSRANFYFLLTPETQEMSELITSPMKRKPSRRRRERNTPSISSPTDDNANDNKTYTTQNPESKQELTPPKSAETVKELKGIINEKIKEENRKNMDTSPTSEASDTPPERWQDKRDAPKSPDKSLESEKASKEVSKDIPKTLGAPDGDADLTEYIVVDLDEVKHTSVELYSGDIYKQRRLRAGAEPGWTACEGLLLLLRDTISVLPEHHLTQAICGAVSAQSLVVLANHRSGAVRAAVVRALTALQRRAPPDVARALALNHCFVHLANQISLYEGTWELVTACAALITKCDVPLEDQLDVSITMDIDDIWVEASEQWTQRCPPLLALLPCCIRDVALSHNITLILRRIIEKSSIRTLCDSSMAEVVVRAIRGVGLGPADMEGRSILLDDLQQLLVALALKALSTHHAMQTVCDIHNLLTFVERTAKEDSVRAVCRDAQAALYIAQLDLAERRLADSAPHTYTNYLSNVLSSAVSLGGGSGAGGGGGAEGGRGEAAARALGAAARALAFLVTHSPLRPPPGAAAGAAHAALYSRLLAALLHAVSGDSGAGGGGGVARRWLGAGGGGAGGAAEWAPLLQEAVWWGLAPAAGARRLQPPLLRTLYAAHAHGLPHLATHDPAKARKLAVYLLSSLQQQHLAAETGGDSAELSVLDWARGWAVSTQAALPERLPRDHLAAEAAALLRADLQRWEAAAAAQRTLLHRSVFSKEGQCARVSESAMALTRRVVEAQNGERKAFMAELRRRAAARGRARASWRRLITDHAHEQGVWHEPRGYPTSWQLDPCEGPGRVRPRLRRAHLRIPPRFLQPRYRHKAELAAYPPPLSSVLDRGACEREGPQLDLNETVAYMARVTHITVDSETNGELLLTDRAIHFVPESRAGGGGGTAVYTEEGGGVARWALSRVVRACTRRWCLQERALELFLAHGARLLAFSSETERAAFLRALSAAAPTVVVPPPDRVEADSLAEAMNLWRNGSITNWEYLMRLNGLAGRSYNDLMQYPVLPFVLADYTSRRLDLAAAESYRDLARPVAVQERAREQHYINTYNDLKAARREGCSPVVARQPHHYASLYSNSGGVLHYLVRLPPFTELFLNYQDNNFDMPDRTFHSLATTWRLITKDSPTDVKELIPELFYLPELFYNNEGLELGMRQCGVGVDEVEVPPWAAEARLFTLLHRQALEAAPVSDRLPHWIDLVFGYKQTGQQAVDAINVFPACTYYGFDPQSLEDEVDRTAAAAMVRTYGQAPRQLLRAPHPHLARDLLAPPPAPDQPEACGGASGVRWGRYCGSPGAAPAVLVARRQLAAAALLPLPAPAARAAAALPHRTALVALTVEGGQSDGSGGDITWGVVSWGHWDNIVRLRIRRDAPPEPLLYMPPVDAITCVSSSTTAGQPLVVGFESGRVEAWRVRVTSAGVRVNRRSLHAHRMPIADVTACSSVSLLASASEDGGVVLWDLERLTYIRTLPNRGSLPVTKVAISPTLSDVATVHETSQRSPATDGDGDSGGGGDGGDDDQSASYERDAPEKYQSIIRVHTVNARFVGSVRVRFRVSCVCYSGAPEGASINVVAAGGVGAGVRLYSSWDLRPLATLPSPHHHHQHLTQLAYSADSQLLFGCYADGTVVAWESEPQRSAPKIVAAHALL